ncbi:MAG TPA: tol-pal system protein YbgF [Kofleriaceae bacterium]|jgi:tol-pal system protein YbgF
MIRQALLISFLVGCASPMTAVRDDNKRLDTEVSSLRDERRAQDRKVRDLQHQLDALKANEATAIAASVPQLPVEVAAPPAQQGGAMGSIEMRNENGVVSRVVGVTEDGTEIVYEGDAALGKPATWGDDEPVNSPPSRKRRDTVDVQPAVVAGPGDRLEVTKRIPRIDAQPAVSARTARPATRDRDNAPTERNADASADYRAAVELVRSGDPTAATALRAFLQKYPRHDYADNAQYWLGESFYAQKDYTHALAEFRNVIETYPRGNKVPDALLKVGFCYQAMGQSEKATAVLQQVVNLYPKTEPAALATKRLDGVTQ